MYIVQYIAAKNKIDNVQTISLKFYAVITHNYNCDKNLVNLAKFARMYIVSILLCPNPACTPHPVKLECLWHWGKQQLTVIKCSYLTSRKIQNTWTVIYASKYIGLNA